LRPLVIDTQVEDQVLGFLFSFALHDFSVSSLFMSLRDAEYSDLDSRIKDVEARLGVIALPGAIGILLDLLPKFSDDSMLHYVVYRLLERLSALKHRNKVVLSGLSLLGRLFRIYTSQKGSSAASQERRIIQKLLKRILDLGATTVDTRAMFQSAVAPDGTLDTSILEMIRAGIKSRWPDHFSFEKRAALIFKEENTKGLPTSGFTFLVCLCHCSDFPRLKALPCVDLDLDRAIPHTESTNYFFLPHIIANTISCQDSCRWPIGAMELWPASSRGYNRIQLSKISVVSYRRGPLPASRATPQSTFAPFSSLPLYLSNRRARLLC
jgi:hypothetical protein